MVPGMEKRQINPWSWQDQRGFAQAWSVTGANTLVFLSGQAPISPDGQLVGEGDFEAQAEQVFQNLRTSFRPQVPTSTPSSGSPFS